jgi:hypothetical protein
MLDLTATLVQNASSTANAVAATLYPSPPDPSTFTLMSMPVIATFFAAFVIYAAITFQSLNNKKKEFNDDSDGKITQQKKRCKGFFEKRCSSNCYEYAIYRLKFCFGLLAFLVIIFEIFNAWVMIFQPKIFGLLTCLFSSFVFMVSIIIYYSYDLFDLTVEYG